MDEQVRAALAKWPDVPDCLGWLALDARGRWRVGETKAGERQPIHHAAMIAFINRNYAAHGRCWVFQNGPQRVFVELEYTPYVWRLMPRADRGCDLVAHTGMTVVPSSVWLDSDGRFLFEGKANGNEPAVGVLHDHDTALAAELLHDADGAPLDDETLAAMSSRDPETLADGPAARLHWHDGDGAPSRLPLKRIASHQVATRFNFEPKPAVALRVDVDTRR